jgi:hypothetical protein
LCHVHKITAEWFYVVLMMKFGSSFFCCHGGLLFALLKSSSTATGSGGSNWQPPDWAAEFKPGVYVLEVLKEVISG